MMDHTRASTSPDTCARRATVLPSPTQLRAKFVEQYLVRRRRMRVVTTVAALALFSVYVLHSLASVSP